MFRRAFRMSIHPGQAAEYERRHRPIWRELEDTLVSHGVTSYSIYLDETSHDLFAYVEIDSEDRWNAIAGTEVCRRWWAHMHELMPSHPDHSPVSRPLREVFHIDVHSHEDRSSS
jgi:L-rhamnose mutarotase